MSTYAKLEARLNGSFFNVRRRIDPSHDHNDSEAGQPGSNPEEIVMSAATVAAYLWWAAPPEAACWHVLFSHLWDDCFFPKNIGISQHGGGISEPDIKDKFMRYVSRQHSSLALRSSDGGISRAAYFLSLPPRKNGVTRRLSNRIRNAETTRDYPILWQPITWNKTISGIGEEDVLACLQIATRASEKFEISGDRLNDWQNVEPWEPEMIARCCSFASWRRPKGAEPLSEEDHNRFRILAQKIKSRIENLKHSVDFKFKRTDAHSLADSHGLSCVFTLLNTTLGKTAAGLFCKATPWNWLDMRPWWEIIMTNGEDLSHIGDICALGQLCFKSIRKELASMTQSYDSSIQANTCAAFAHSAALPAAALSAGWKNNARTEETSPVACLVGSTPSVSAALVALETFGGSIPVDATRSDERGEKWPPTLVACLRLLNGRYLDWHSKPQADAQVIRVRIQSERTVVEDILNEFSTTCIHRKKRQREVRGLVGQKIIPVLAEGEGIAQPFDWIVENTYSIEARQERAIRQIISVGKVSTTNSIISKFQAIWAAILLTAANSGKCVSAPPGDISGLQTQSQRQAKLLALMLIQPAGCLIWFDTFVAPRSAWRKLTDTCVYFGVIPEYKSKGCSLGSLLYDDDNLQTTGILILLLREAFRDNHYRKFMKNATTFCARTNAPIDRQMANEALEAWPPCIDASSDLEQRALKFSPSTHGPEYLRVDSECCDQLSTRESKPVFMASKGGSQENHWDIFVRIDPWSLWMDRHGPRIEENPESH